MIIVPESEHKDTEWWLKLPSLPFFSLPAIPLMPVWDVYRNHPPVKVSNENESISSAVQHEKTSLGTTLFLPHWFPKRSESTVNVWIASDTFQPLQQRRYRYFVMQVKYLCRCCSSSRPPSCPHGTDRCNNWVNSVYQQDLHAHEAASDSCVSDLNLLYSSLTSPQ